MKLNMARSKAGPAGQIESDFEKQLSMMKIADEGFWEWDSRTDRFWLNPYFCGQHGIRRFMKKPVKMAELSSAIQEVIS